MSKVIYSNNIKYSYCAALGLFQIRKPNFKICKDSRLVKYFAFFLLTKAVINMIFVDLGFSKKDLYLLFLEENSHGHTSGLNKAIHIFFSLSRYIY
jgi:hypothetical protein